MVMQNGLKHKINAWVKRFDRKHGNDKNNQSGNDNERLEAEYLRLLEAVEKDKLYTKIDLDRETFAKRMGISRHTLNKIISTNTGGLSFPQWINRIRIGYACQILRDEPGKTVAGVAGESGLTPDNLRRLFRQQLGISPSDYRREL